MSLGVELLNVADRLDEFAHTMPQAIAIAEPTRRIANGRRSYRTVTFKELRDDVDDVARGLVASGLQPGMRLALFVPPSIDFVTLVFALLKSGGVQVLIDPGIGPRNLLGCLADAEPRGFVAVPAMQAIRSLLRRSFSQATLNVTVSRRVWWNGVTLDELRQRGRRQTVELPTTSTSDPAAIIFTSGSTGPPKGVLYCHGNFDRQVTEIRDLYGIEPGEIDLPCFPLFGLFNAAMGVTTVLPRINFSRPSMVDPQNIVEAINQWQVTQSFASPAVWNRVGRFCHENGIRLPSLRRVMSAGAPVAAPVLASMKAVIHSDGDVHTPYGATEALPVATIAASEVLAQTWPLTEKGRGVCVGRRFPGIDWRIVRILDGPIQSIGDTQELPPGEIGELIVCGPVVTTQYATRREANRAAKIHDDGVGFSFWHRMGDCGYLDEDGRFWFCGRVAHRVVTEAGPMYSVPCEEVFNRHPGVFRSALVGVGPVNDQVPVIIVEPKPQTRPQRRRERQRLFDELGALAATNPQTATIRHFLIHPAMPVDVRHNAKICREQLAPWAEKQLRATQQTRADPEPRTLNPEPRTLL
jgi:acyl-CoA synthetase (AMP-forming)/AMP-acid ligase II